LKLNWYYNEVKPSFLTITFSNNAETRIIDEVRLIQSINASLRARIGRLMLKLRGYLFACSDL